MSSSTRPLGRVVWPNILATAFSISWTLWSALLLQMTSSDCASTAERTPRSGRGPPRHLIPESDAPVGFGNCLCSSFWSGVWLIVDSAGKLLSGLQLGAERQQWRTPGGCARDISERIAHAREVHSDGREDLSEGGPREAHIRRAAEPLGAYSLGDGAFDARTGGVLGHELGGGCSFP